MPANRDEDYLAPSAHHAAKGGDMLRRLECNLGVHDPSLHEPTDGVAATRIDALKRQESMRQRGSWAHQRAWLANLLESNLYSCILGLIVGTHTILIIQETDIRAAASNLEAWREIMGYIILVIYVADLSLRLYVYRRSFWTNTWNLFDSVVVLADIVSLALASLLGDMPYFAVLRVCRLARLLRVVRFVRMFKELDVMLMGFVSAMKAMFWASCMLVVILTWFSIIAVEVLHPIVKDLAEKGAWQDCERCKRAFGSVMESNLTFMQQIIAGDSWGLVSIPIIEAEPIAGVFLLIVLVSVEFGVLNLVLTVIVDMANTAREADEQRKISDKVSDFESMKKKLLKLCEELDEDGSGELSVTELMNGMDHNPRFAMQMALLDIGKEDMSVVFNVLDEDNSGFVLYKEFVEQVHKMKSQDTHTTLIFIKGYLNEVRRKVKENLAILRDEVLASNLDMASSMRKVLFGGHLSGLTHADPEQLKPEGSDAVSGDACGGSGVLRVEAQWLGAGKDGAGLEDAPSSTSKPYWYQSIQPGVLAASDLASAAKLSDGEAGSRTQPQGMSPGPHHEPFLGLVKLEDTLRRLEKQVSGDLAQVVHEIAGKVDDQLALMQDWGPPACPTALSIEQTDPIPEHVDAKVAKFDEPGVMFNKPGVNPGLAKTQVQRPKLSRV